MTTLLDYISVYHAAPTLGILYSPIQPDAPNCNPHTAPSPVLFPQVPLSLCQQGLWKKPTYNPEVLLAAEMLQNCIMGMKQQDLHLGSSTGHCLVLSHHSLLSLHLSSIKVTLPPRARTRESHAGIPDFQFPTPAYVSVSSNLFTIGGEWWCMASVLPGLGSGGAPGDWKGITGKCAHGESVLFSPLPPSKGVYICLLTLQMLHQIKALDCISELDPVYE